ncbi:RHS repeat-associated core domain-containing protein [Streptomyces sp. NBC_00557]|uniref:RHS repeat-associated core domain-containing protein n=1 Tax=Streptomyces sp. NBC_00557 TaxID=2975776 RepID=UPI002E80CE59|nr:DNA/RNA non-specific endonuclease [Streptomyces sp. NBC_00557]WUC39633.1 DNA/RNA non-specific endonuclease [Streptomyces sp. NBC_00557]
MGYTIPGWLDQVLDYIGIHFPNVDEDDYRHMATAMREFADKFEGHGADAHKAVEQILASSKGWAVHSMQAHWNQVKAGHLDKIPELARLFADACDVVADIIFGMKTKAEAELAVMAGSVGLSIGAAFLTGGLSAVLGAAEVTAMRQLVKRIIDEAADQIVNELIAKVTEPVNAKLEAMVEDAVLSLANDAFSLPPDPAGAGPHAGGGEGGGHGRGHGHGGMQLASAGGVGGGFVLDSAGGGGAGGADLFIDHEEFESGAGKVSFHGSELHLNSAAPLGRAKGFFGRTKGKDPFTRAFDSVLEGALHGSEKALGKIAKHITETVPDRVRAASRLHKHNDLDIGDRLHGIHTPKGDGGAGSGHGGTPASGRKLEQDLKIDSAKLSQQARALENKHTCGDPIDMATGQMILAQTDVELPGVLPLVLWRTHLSGYVIGRSFGPSWACTLDERLEKDDALGGYWWHREDGSSLAYPRLPDLPGDRVSPAEGAQLPLTYVTRGTTYVLTAEDPRTGLIRHFEASAVRNGVWWLVSIEDRNGNTVTVERDERDVPTMVTHTGGYRIKIDTSPEGDRVTGLSALTDDAALRLRAFSYNEAGDLAEVRNAVDAATAFSYDETHRITGWRDSNGTEFTYVYDAAGRVIETRGTDGILNSRLEYGDVQEDGSSTATYTDSLGNSTIYRANRRGQIISVTDPLGHTTTQQWDRHDHLLSRTDPLGRTTRWEWDAVGDLVTVTAPDGATSRTEYNDLHLPTRWTGPDGSQIRQEFDERGNRTLVIGPDGAVTRYTHHPTGAPATVTDALGAVLTIEADPAGLPLALTDARDARTECHRDVLGRVVSLTDALGATTSLVWDAEGRLLERTAADGSRETWRWDGEGNCLQHTDSLGTTTRHTYGPFDLLRSSVLADGSTYTFTYDTERRLTAVTNPAGLTWSFRYNERGELLSETDFDGRTITSAFDAAGQLASRRMSDGRTWTFTYDVVGRLVTKDVDGACTNYSYDAAGRLEHARTATSELTRTYDAAGRVLAETVDGRTMRYRYDALGQCTGRTTPTGAVSEKTWDAVGNHTGLQLGQAHQLAFEHDLLGREIKRILSDHAGITSQWDELGHLTNQTLHAGDRRIRDRHFSYRADGMLTGITDLATGRTTQFQLDPMGRPLTVASGSHQTEAYRYDSAGNQTFADWPAGPAAPDAAGERALERTMMLAAGRTTYRYDEAGRVVERRKKRLSHKPDIWRYTWDPEGRLTTCTTPDGTVWQYRYDPLGRRTAKCRLTAEGQVAEEIHFSWDGTRLAEEANISTGTLVSWEYDGYRPVTQYERKPRTQDEFDTRFFAIVTDLIGTPTELVDEQGRVAWQTRTTVWGTTAWNTNATAYTPLRFPGQYADPETGLHYNYFRHYDPETARYTSPDPLGLVPAPNPLAYVANPHEQFDPLGLTPCDEDDVTWGGRVHYRELGPGGRAQGVTATLTRNMMGGKTDPRVDPAGWQSNKGFNRAHLLGAQIGGSNKDPRNFVTMHSYANSPMMRRYETQVRKAVDKGEVIEYSATPVYKGDSVVPEGVWLEAHGSDGFQFMPKGATTGTNRIYIPNEPKR